ncbi:YhfC family glutamic-type intramembrane protease [Carnobacterium sp.]|uniref:YhfC family glutamic-type intramembrane protease n=1 Tax=Carnobacterium sp. TaxID=48221 RepID=UPI0028A75BCB|nr:YhfC family glutamic-type intramembrane protease [Carnobacterium sp.]
MKNKIVIFLLGSLSFIVSQPMLRFSLLDYLNHNTTFILYYGLNPLLVGILIAFSAGIFEESFRFIFKKFLLRPSKTIMAQPILFGLGHGLAEMVLILGPYITEVPFSSLTIAIIERILSVILHIGLTIIVWNGFQLNNKLKYLGIAILVHGMIDSLIPILNLTKNGLILMESSLVIIALFMVVYSYRSRKYYLKEEKK